jgi:hypothetical protein
VRGRILRRWYAGCRIAPLAGHPMVGLSLLDSQGQPLYVAHAHNDALRWMRGILSEHRHRYGGRGSQEFRPRVHYQRYGLPDFGVCTRRFEGRNTRLAPSGRRGPTPRLERRSRRFWRDMVEVSRSGAARRMISRHKIQQNTARNDRIIDNMVICRTFLRSVVYPAIDRRR